MKVVPKYTKAGVSFSSLPSGAPFWWIDQLLIKLCSFDDDEFNAVSLSDGTVFALEESRIVVPANVKVVEKESIEI